MRTTIVSGANSLYFPLLGDLVRSIRDKPESRGIDLSVFDLGLEETERQWLREHGATLVRPGWDLLLARRGPAPEHEKAMVSRPFLPKHFPGYDLYVWLDSDTWVQEWSAVELLIRAAASGALAVVAEVDRAYPVGEIDLRIERVLGIPYRVSSYNFRKFRDAFGSEVARHLVQQARINSGAFALLADAPHWETWRECYQRTLRRSRRDGGDQVSLNHVCYTGDLPVELLPATCNWIVGKARPLWDPACGRLVEPYVPHQPIGIVHLTGPAKDTEYELSSLGGGTVRRRLRYPERPPQNA